MTQAVAPLPAILLVAAASFAQDHPNPDLEVARQFVAGLKLDQVADQAAFQRLGYDRAAAFFNVVTTAGQARNATPRQWTEMHRAIGGLIELYVAEGQLFKASVFATYQDICYRNFEGDYVSALAAAEQAQRLQEQSGVTANAFMYRLNIGEDLMRLGRLDEGLGVFYAAHRLVTDPASSIGAIVWSDIVTGEIARGNLAAARRQCGAFMQQAISSAPPLFRARAWLARARLETAGNRYDDALNSLRSARQQVGNEEDASEFDWEIVNELLSIVLTSMESIPYDEAMELGQRIDKQFPGLPLPVSPFAQQAMDYRRLLAGEFDALLRKATAAFENARAAKDIPSQIEALRRLAVIYAFTNSGKEQIASLEQAVRLERSLSPEKSVTYDAGSQHSYFRLLAMLGEAYANHKEPAKAGECFDEITRGIDALSSGAAKSTLAIIYGDAKLGKASVAELEHNSERARELLNEALNAPANGPARFTRSAILLQSARLKRDLDQQPLDAVEDYEAAVRALHDQRDKRSEIAARLQLARYLAVEASSRVPNSRQRASEHLKLAEAAASAIEFADAQWRVLFLEGIVEERAQNPEQAIDLYRQAVARLDRLRAGLSQEDQRQAFMDDASIQELYRRLIALLTSQGHREQAWEYLERGKARSFLELLRGRRFRATSTSTPGARQLEMLERQIVNVRAKLAFPTASGRGGTSQDAAILHARLRDLENEFVLARQGAELQGSRSGQELSLRPLTIPDVQARLGAGTALIEYAFFDNKLTAFVIARGQVVQVVWPADLDDLRSRVNDARELLGRRDSDDELRPVLESLSATLIQPVLAKVPAATRKLIIVPSDFLNYLPFQVLPCGGQGVVIDRFAVSYLPAASALAFLKSAHTVGPRFFLGAIGNLPVDGLPPLPGTLNEVRGIAQTVTARQIAVEKAFTYHRVRRALLEDDAVHLATHGLLNEDSPLLNAVVTSPAAEQPSRLSLYELTGIKLKARLVVLSACNTGLGELRKGDEITGLTRMFLQAGADTVIASLWSVSDRATALLMKGFYRALERGNAPAQALRSSALSVRKMYPNPYYWAAFVVNGAE